MKRQISNQPVTKFKHIHIILILSNLLFCYDIIRLTHFLNGSTKRFPFPRGQGTGVWKSTVYTQEGTNGGACREKAMTSTDLGQ